MKPAQPPPGDDEIDRLLASRYKDTTPEFEARWRDLRRDLRQTPPARRWPAAWFGLAVAGLAALLLLVVHPGRPLAPAQPPVPEASPALVQLFEMDEVLTPALPLLDADNRTALLHLPLHATLPPRT